LQPLLNRQAQRPLAGGQQAQGGQPGQHRAGQLGHRGAEVFAVVQHQQQAAASHQAQPARCIDLRAVAVCQAQGLAHRRIHLLAFGHRSQIDQQRGLAGPGLVGHHGLRQPGLAHARRAQQGDEAVLLQQVDHTAQFRLAAEHRRQQRQRRRRRRVCHRARARPGGRQTALRGVARRGGHNLRRGGPCWQLRGRHQAVATPWHGGDHALAEQAPQGPDLHCQVVGLHRLVGPAVVDQLALADGAVALFGQQEQQVHRPPADRQGLAGARQLPLSRVQLEVSKAMDAGHLPPKRRPGSC
jgi:hypothetical protein